MEGNLRLKIDWASLIVGRKFTLVLLCIWGQFSNFKPPGGLYLEGRFNGGFFTLPVWGAYTWRGLFSEFYGIRYVVKNNSCHPSRGSVASHSNLDFEMFKLSLNLSLTHYNVSNEPARNPFYASQYNSLSFTVTIAIATFEIFF